jgi:hypothetical protein
MALFSAYVFAVTDLSNTMSCFIHPTGLTFCISDTFRDSLLPCFTNNINDIKAKTDINLI